MKLCVVGAGNIGLALASVLALDNKYEVIIYTNKKIDKLNFTFKDVENTLEFKNLNFNVDNNIETALKNCDYIFCTYPAFLRKQFLESATKYIDGNCNLGFVPGYGGAEYMCEPLIEKGVTVFGLQRVPFVARQENKKISMLLSRKKELFVATIPKQRGKKISDDLNLLLKIPTVILNEYLAVTLAPSNPLLHLCGLYNVFKDYKENDYFEKQLMFYEEWNDETSELLMKYDSELQEICHKLYPLNLEEVISLKDYYESQTAHAMTKKLKSIEAFKVVKVPLLEKDGKYYPDFTSRMFVEDFPYGIAVIKYFALLTKVKTPAIDTILKFYENKTGICYFNSDNTFGKDITNTGIPGNYGLDTIEKINDFYNAKIKKRR